MSLNQVIVKLKNEHLWDEFPKFFDQLRCEALVDLLNKAPNITKEDIDTTNKALEIYQELMGLDVLADLDARRDYKKEREGGGLKDRLGKLLRLRRR